MNNGTNQNLLPGWDDPVPQGVSKEFYQVDLGPDRYLTKEDLLTLREFEDDTFQFNRALCDDYLNALDDRICLPIQSTFSHQQCDGPYDRVVRALVPVPPIGIRREDIDEKTKLTPETVDMPFEFYDELSFVKDVK